MSQQTTDADRERNRIVAQALTSLRSLNGVDTPWRAPVPDWYKAGRLVGIRGQLMASVLRQARLEGVEL